MTPTRQPQHALPAAHLGSRPSDYAALRDFVERAAHGDIDLQPSAAETPDGMRLPSGWYAPTTAPPARPVRLRPEMRAAAFGLGAGLLVLVPAALWSQMSGGTARDTTASLASSFASTGQDTTPPAVVDVVAVRTISTTTSAADPTIDAAQQLIKAGDVIAARTLLSTAAAARNPTALFVMAETYDPNMLAAWGARGVGADAERARALYAAAQGLGHEKAAGRLQSLR